MATLPEVPAHVFVLGCRDAIDLATPIQLADLSVVMSNVSVRSTSRKLDIAFRNWTYAATLASLPTPVNPTALAARPTFSALLARTALATLACWFGRSTLSV